MLLDVRDVEGLLAVSPVRRRRPAARCVGLEVQGESAAGENFGSTFLKVAARFRDEDRGEEFTEAVVCKQLPPTQYLREVFNVKVSFPKEVGFYRFVVPALEALQSELRVPDAERLGSFPALYGARLGGGDDPSAVDDEAILILEDLSVGGYYCGDRHQGLDLEHCRLAVRELARFHAAGIALRRLRPAVFKGPGVHDALLNFMHNQPETGRENTERFATSTLEMVLEKVPEVLDVVDEARLRRAALPGHEPDDAAAREPFATILHCDFWVNNMMFHRGADGRPDGLKMVDFQLTEIGSGLRDLLFFVYTSADSDALAHVDGLLRGYHEELTRYARLHGLDVTDMDWEAFERDLKLTAHFNFRMVFIMLCIIRSQNAVEKTDTNSDDAFSASVGVSELAKRRYLELLSDWAKRGWI